MKDDTFNPTQKEQIKQSRELLLAVMVFIPMQMELWKRINNIVSEIESLLGY